MFLFLPHIVYIKLKLGLVSDRSKLFNIVFFHDLASLVSIVTCFVLWRHLVDFTIRPSGVIYDVLVCDWLIIFLLQTKSFRRETHIFLIIAVTFSE